MSQTLMSQLVKYEKACCIYGYFVANKEKSNREIADHLGVSPTTVRSWRRRIFHSEVTCGYGASGHNGCIFKPIN